MSNVVRWGEQTEAPLERRTCAARVDAVCDRAGRAAISAFGKRQALHAITALHQLHDHTMRGKALVHVTPVLSPIDGIEDVWPRDVLPGWFTALLLSAVGPVARPPLRLRRKVVKMLDALHDVAIVMTDDDVPAAFRCDLGADALADDALVPEVVGAAVCTDPIGDHVRVEVIGISMRGEDVLMIVHSDRC